MPNAQPVKVDGVNYASKQDACYFLRAQGFEWQVIADKVGTTVFGAKAGDQAAKRRLAKQPTHKPDASPGQWTPEKRDKVRRLFGKTMILIAEAVQVPAGELLTYVLHGVIPPSQPIKDPGDIRWNGAHGPASVQLPVPTPDADEAQILPREAFEQSDIDPPDHVEADQFIAVSEPAQPQNDEPDRDDDEAELARLAALDALEAEGRNIVRGTSDKPEVAPPAPARFQEPAATARPVAKLVGEVRLIDETGRFLHESLEGMTTNPRFAWKGDAAKLKAVQNRLPHTRQLDVVPV